MMAWRVLLVVAAVLLGCVGPVRAGATLAKVKAAGTLSCGVLSEPEDYGKSDNHGALVALGADFCRAVSAAILGDANRIALAAFPDENHGFAALQAGRVDLLLGASPAISSALVYRLRFAPPLFFDGEGLLVRRETGIASLGDLAGRQVCFIANTEAETVLESETRLRNLHVLPFPFEENGEMQVALLAGHCAAVIDSVSRLGIARAGFKRAAKEFGILPDQLSVEPMTPALRDDDPQWAAVVGAIVDALLLAEAEGITRANAAVAFEGAGDRPPGGLAGFVPGIDATIVDRHWAMRALEAVGNYAEMYERDCGSQSPLGLSRRANALWSNGGLMIDHPLR